MEKQVNKLLRDFKEYSREIIVISTFEDYEIELGIDFGDVWEDFGDQFLLFRAGFIAGGSS